MQISDEHVVVVVVVVRRVVVVVVRRVVVVVVVVVGAALFDVVVVVVDVVVVLLAEDGDDADADVRVVVVVGAVDCSPGGMGSTPPASVGTRSWWSAWSVNAPKAKSVHVIAPTTAPTASRPCSLRRVDPIGVLRVNPATTGSDGGIYHHPFG